MADGGYTKLEAVNRMLIALGQYRVGSLDTGGTSDAAEAEYFLDLVTRQVLERGWDCNTDEFYELTSVDVGSSVYKIAVPTDAVRMTGTGKYANRDYTIRGGFVYDKFEGTDDFGEEVTIPFKILRDLDFEDASPDVKTLIVEEACQFYRRRRLPDKIHDEFQTEERSKAELYADKPMPERGERNDSHLIPRSGREN